MINAENRHSVTGGGAQNGFMFLRASAIRIRLSIDASLRKGRAMRRAAARRPGQPMAVRRIDAGNLDRQWYEVQIADVLGKPVVWFRARRYICIHRHAVDANPGKGS